MMPNYLPEPFPRFVNIYNELHSKEKWYEKDVLPISAMLAITCQGEANQIAESIRQTAEQIKANKKWLGELRTSLRFVVSAMLVANQDKADDFLLETERVHKLFRAEKLRRGRVYETMAILIMRNSFFKAPIQLEAIQRFKAIYQAMKKYHWWLTGPDDFPACAMLVTQKESPEQIGFTIEKIYQTLSKKGFTTGDPLQTAANLLYLTHKDPVEIANSYSELASKFRQKGVSIWQSDYDSLAILSFLPSEPEIIVDKVVNYREKIKDLLGNTSPMITFNLATNMTFLELIRLNTKLKSISDVKSLLDLQVVINASIASSVAVTTASVAGT